MPYKDREERRVNQRLYYAAHKAAVIERATRWAKENTERRREIARESRRRNYSGCTERDRERARAWYAEHTEVVKQRTRAWAKEHPELVVEYQRTRTSRIRGSFVEAVDRNILYQRDTGRCGICGEQVDPKDFHIDHIKPVALGGEHSYANTRIAHPRCNRTRHFVDFVPVEPVAPA